jgi:hypothetical protein
MLVPRGESIIMDIISSWRICRIASWQDGPARAALPVVPGLRMRWRMRPE